MPRRRYTHAEKARFVAAAEVNGVTATAEQMGIPRKTGEYWLDSPEFADLRQKTREERRDGYRVLVHKIQSRLVELIPTMEPRDLTILLGVSQDKDLLLSGDATSRSEHKDVTRELDRDTRRRITEWFDQHAASDGGPDAGVPAGDSTAVRE